MDHHVVIGTAGHVDHGKTALVKALTGTDTDRLAEEKRRGITIDLGFAALDLGDGLHASVVDVPGHEDFVRNMVAGATGVDVALLVVAADEGVMPQTEEHLAILEFLAVRTGVVALTKADLAEPTWLELVAADLKERLARTPIHWEAIEPVSVVDGRGLATLRGHLAASARAAGQRDADDVFRLPVDRVFSVAGAGTVVTGTTWSGSARVGDQVTIFPGERTARVRGVEVHGQPAQAARPGRRTALALVGVERADLARGSVVVQHEGWRETSTIDVMATLLPHARGLSQHTRVRLHHGTAEVLARVTPAGPGIAPGESGIVRLRLERPIVARWGDRAVLRSYSPMVTIGGAVVIDPRPPARPRRPSPSADKASPDEATRIAAFVAEAGNAGMPLADLTVRLGIHPKRNDASTLGAKDVVRLGSLLVSGTCKEEARRRAEQALAAYHKSHPLEPGMRRDDFRAVLGRGAVVEALETVLLGENRFVAEGGVVRLASHRAQLEAADRDGLGPKLIDQLTRANYEGRTTAELASATGVAETRVSGLAEFFVRNGKATRIGRDRYYESSALNRAVALTQQIIRQTGSVGPAQLRDALGLSRKYIMPFLEWMDAQGYTVRTGDVRHLGPKVAVGDAGA